MSFRADPFIGVNILRAGRSGNKPNYVERRTERYRVNDGLMIANTVTVQIRLSELVDPKIWPRLHGAVPVPVARVRRPVDRSATSSLELKMNGLPVSWMPGIHERRHVAAGVSFLAEVVLYEKGEASLDPSMRSNLQSLVEEPPAAVGEGRADIEALRRLPGGSILAEDPAFTHLLRDARKFFWVTALVEPELPKRAIFEYTYKKPLRLNSGPSHESMIAIARRQPKRLVIPDPEVEFTFDAIDAGSARSFHIEFDAPPSLAAKDAVLRVKNPKIDDEPIEVEGHVAGSTSHAYYDGGGPLNQGTFHVAIRPAITGTVQTLLALTCVTSAMLVTIAVALTFVDLDTVQEVDRNSLVTGLFLVPALLATTLAGRPTHPLSSRMLMGIRATTSFAAFSLAMATLASIPDWQSIGTFRAIWACGAVAGLFCAYRATREGRKLSSQPNRKRTTK